MFAYITRGKLIGGAFLPSSPLTNLNMVNNLSLKQAELSFEQIEMVWAFINLFPNVKFLCFLKRGI